MFGLVWSKPVAGTGPGERRLNRRHKPEDQTFRLNIESQFRGTMNHSGYSVTLDLEDNASWDFLADLRLTHDRSPDVPAHVTVVSSLKLSPAKLDPLEDLLTAVAGRTAPFDLVFHEVQLLPQRRPYARHCIAIPVNGGACLQQVWQKLHPQYAFRSFCAPNVSDLLFAITDVFGSISSAPRIAMTLTSLLLTAVQTHR
jgi:hypothetical protein